MREFKKHRSQRSELTHFFLRLAGALLLLVITAAAVKAAWDMYGRLAIASRGLGEAASELADMQKEHLRVSAAVGDLSSTRGQEELVREHYGLVRPGEGVIQIVHNTESPKDTSMQGNGWVSRLFHTLFSW